MPFDYRKLEGLVKEKCRTRAIFAYKMGLSERSISLKMNGKTQWKQTEICTACEILGISNEDIPKYFFDPKAQNIEHIKTA